MGLFIALLLLSSTTALPSCSNVNVTELSTKSFQENGIHFARNLFRLAREDSKDGNVLFSPASISLALGMLLEGARGTTRDEIKTHLVKDVPDKELSESFRRLMNSIGAGPKIGGYSIYTANKIYAQSKEPIKEEFMQTLQKCFNSEAKLVDFTSKFEEVRKEVNKWVESKTDDKIHDLLPKDSVDQLTRFILVNAIYLQADWLKPFTKNSETFEGKFHSPNDEEKNVTYMKHGRDEYKYMENDKMEVLELPYIVDKFSMYIILPKKSDESRDDIENELFDDDFLLSIDSKLEDVKLEVTIPKFELEQDLPLKSLLEEMGMEKMFGGEADLSGINGRKNLYVSGAFHKAYIKVDRMSVEFNTLICFWVNEKGTEAAAATGITGRVKSIPKQFKADHPFFFLIKHKPSNSILFAGHLAVPK